MEEKVRKEEIRIDGAELLQKVKELIKEGNTRRIIIKNENKVLLEIPLTVGVVGVGALALFAPVLVAVGAVAGIVTRCTLIIEKVEKKEK